MSFSFSAAIVAFPGHILVQDIRILVLIANAQTLQSLRCSQTQSLDGDVDEGSVEPQIQHFVKSSQHVKNWYQYVTYFVPINISHFVKNTHDVNFHIAYMRILHIDKIPPNLLPFQLDSNSSQFCH